MAREHGLGRLQAPQDGRDLQYRLRSAMPQFVKPVPRKRAYNEGSLLDQGAKPHCVAFSGLGFMGAAPLMRAEDYQTSPVYLECQRADEWEGENYDGTSVRALMKVMQTRGYIESYGWGQTVDEAIAWVNGGYGTVIVGTNWHAEFDEIGHDGFMRIPSAFSTPIGGHAYRLNWFDKKIGGFLVINSWGPGWGLRNRRGEMLGRAYMKPELLEALLRAQGEIAAPTQTRIKPVKV